MDKEEQEFREFMLEFLPEVDIEEAIREWKIEQYLKESFMEDQRNDMSWYEDGDYYLTWSSD